MARPPSGRISVVRMRTAVVLPAPLGPSTPRTVPRGTDRSIQCSALTSPNDLVNPSTRMAGPPAPPLICDTFRIWTEHAQDRPARHRQVDTTQRFDLTERFGQALHEDGRPPGDPADL